MNTTCNPSEHLSSFRHVWMAIYNRTSLFPSGASAGPNYWGEPNVSPCTCSKMSKLAHMPMIHSHDELNMGERWRYFGQNSEILGYLLYNKGRTTQYKIVIPKKYLGVYNYYEKILGCFQGYILQHYYVFMFPCHLISISG